MSRQEELQTIDSTTLGGLIETRIAEEIREEVRDKLVADQLYVVNRELVGKPANQLDFYKRGTVEVKEIPEGGTFPQSEPTYQKIVTIGVAKQGCMAQLTHEAIRDARVDLIADTRREIAVALANRKDFLAFRDGFFGGEKQSAEEFTGDGTTREFTLSYNPIIDPSATVDGEEVEIEKYDPRTGAVTLKEAPASDATVSIEAYKVTVPVVETATAGKITLADIDGARSQLVANKVWPDTLVLNQKDAQQLLQESEFTDIAKYGEIARRALLRAEIGRYHDIQTLTSTVIPEGLAVVMKRKDGVVHLVKEGIRVELKEDLETDSVKIFASETYGNGIIDKNTVCAISIGL